jgi:hypothetical protein
VLRRVSGALARQRDKVAGLQGDLTGSGPLVKPDLLLIRSLGGFAENPMLVQEKVPGSDHNGGYDLTDLIARPQPINEVDYYIDGKGIEGHQKAVLKKADTSAVSSTKCEDPLKREIECQAG